MSSSPIPLPGIQSRTRTCQPFRAAPSNRDMNTAFIFQAYFVVHEILHEDEHIPHNRGIPLSL